MKLRCPYCSQKMTTDGELETGTPVECPKCAKTFAVTAGNVVNEAAERAAKTTSLPRPLPVEVKTPMCSVSSVISGVLMVVAIIVALSGIAQFSNPAAQSAIHQIYFALTTVAFLLGAIFIMLIALLVKR